MSPIIDFFVRNQVLLFHAALGLTLFVGLSALVSTLWGAPWVPSSLRTVRKMLDMAQLQPGEKLVDLGAGDGRIVILAARSYRARAEGVEIDPMRWLFANTLIRILGLRDRARVQLGNMFEFNFSDADVVTMYLLQSTNQRLKAHLAEQLQPGARVVSHSFSISEWTPIALDDDSDIFVYEIGNTGAQVRTRLL